MSVKYLATLFPVAVKVLRDQYLKQGPDLSVRLQVDAAPAATCFFGDEAPSVLQQPAPAPRSGTTWMCVSLYAGIYFTGVYYRSTCDFRLERK